MCTSRSLRAMNSQLRCLDRALCLRGVLRAAAASTTTTTTAPIGFSLSARIDSLVQGSHFPDRDGARSFVWGWGCVDPRCASFLIDSRCVCRIDLPSPGVRLVAGWWNTFVQSESDEWFVWGYNR